METTENATEQKFDIKTITEVTLNGKVFPVKVNFAAIKKAFGKIKGDSLFDAIGNQTPDATLVKLQCALPEGVTEDQCMQIIDETPSVYANITRTYSEAASKFYATAEVGNSPAPEVK